MTEFSAKPRRWLQFSLRTLFIVMLLVAAFFGGRESMRPAIRSEQLKAEQARVDAALAQADAMLQSVQARAAEMTAQKALQQALSALDEAAVENPPDKGPPGKSGAPAENTERPDR